MDKAKPFAVIDCMWSPEHGYALTPAGAFNREFLTEDLKRLAARLGGPVPLRISFAMPAKQRSGQQNKLMWELIALLAEHQSGRPPTPAERTALYCDLLADYGSDVAYITAPPGAERLLAKAYRAVKAIEHRPDGRVEYMAVLGSSTFTTREMHDFLEHIFDRLAEEGVYDPRLPGWRQDWLRLQK